jgi:hypothetical protein
VPHRNLLLLAAALLAAPGAAQSLKPFIDCSAKADDAERLACYDAAAAATSAEARAIAQRRERERAAAAEARAALEAKAAAEAEARARQAQAERFGSEGFRIGGSDDRINALSAKVQEALSDGFGRAVLLLDNGQMWRQTEGFSLPPLRGGDAVEIRRGAVGGYLLTVPRIKRTIPVRRMR